MQWNDLEKQLEILDGVLKNPQPLADTYGVSNAQVAAYVINQKAIIWSKKDTLLPGGANGTSSLGETDLRLHEPPSRAA